jgi:hypothetical protein
MHSRQNNGRCVKMQEAGKCNVTSSTIDLFVQICEVQDTIASYIWIDHDGNFLTVENIIVTNFCYKHHYHLGCQIKSDLRVLCNRCEQDNVRMHDTKEGSLTYHQVAIHHYYFVIMKHKSLVLWMI